MLAEPAPPLTDGNPVHLSSGLPMLLIWGNQDRIIPVAHGYVAYDDRPGSRLEVLDGIGHFPHVESPTAVLTVIDDSSPPQRNMHSDRSYRL